MFHMNFKVRLTDFEIHSIKSIVEQHDPEARIDLSIKSHEEFKHDSFFNQDHIINSLFQL